MELPVGIYEQVINKAFKKSLIENEELKQNIGIETIEMEGSQEVFAHYVQQFLLKGLNIIKEEAYRSTKGKDVDKDSVAVIAEIDACNRIIDMISDMSNDSDLLEWKIGDKGEKLINIWENNTRNDIPRRPITSLSQSGLFVGGRTLFSLADELCREIETSNEVMLLVSFIKVSGINLIMESLRKFTENDNHVLRILTTTYMGATEYEAIRKLSELKNTQIKISYDSRSTRLHAKSYIFKRNTGFSTIFIGSSNLSRAAISDGMEWNIKLTNQDAPQVLDAAIATFETYWNSKDFDQYTNNEEDVKKLHIALTNEGTQRFDAINDIFDWRPMPFQSEILEELKAEREIHKSYKNLIVAATGTGKTVIAAMDYRDFVRSNPGEKNRLLYIAHREEILVKSLNTFRSILKDYNFGELYNGKNTPIDLDHIFMSIQTFASKEFHLQKPSNYYDYLIVDETHHAAAKSYAELFKHFEPKILLGLTATPERMDGLDILSFFNNRIAAEIRLPEAINREILAPFQYYGITDVNYRTMIRYNNGKFNENDMNEAFNNKERAELIRAKILEYQPYVERIKCIGFCASIEHAAYMADFFNSIGWKSKCLTGNSRDEERLKAPRDLKNGSINFIFTVDLYNEGVDIPEVNTVLFLRPTESLTIFIQQLGRGLRRADNKAELLVLDFVGQFDNSYSGYEQKLRYMASGANRSVREQIEKGFVGLPLGCNIRLEKVAKQRIINMIPTCVNKKKLIKQLREFEINHQCKPTLEQFIREYEIPLMQIYKNYTYTELYSEAFNECIPEDNQLFFKGFRKLVQIDSVEWIDTIFKLLDGFEPWTHLDGLFASMFYYSFYDDYPENNGFESVFSFIKYVSRTNRYCEELKSLLSLKRLEVKFIEGTVDLPYECPLRVHSTYFKNQILAGLGQENRISNMREGVMSIADKHTDILFIDLIKSERDYTPTTMYKDYPISEDYFHWQSQAKTTVHSETGRRYIEQRSNGTNILLFVRERKMKNGLTMPFMFLGKGKYVKHEGEKPISIVWEMENKIPQKILDCSIS